MSALPTPNSPRPNCAPDPARCPLCGEANDCQLCTSAAYKGPCWCERLTVPDELLARLPAEARGQACICRRCIEAALRQRPLPALAPGDCYRDSATGLLVFTAQYHRKRGYCCGSGCRHCPWASTERGTQNAEPKRRAMLGAPVPLVALLGLLSVSLSGFAETLSEDFATDPTARGWHATGTTNLFQWNAAEQRLDVTWDTANPHSFFALSLGRPLTARDDFAFAFDLTLTDIAGGVRANRPGAMPLSVGLLNFAGATTNRYLRGAGRGRQLLEFTWFPAGEIPGFGTVEPTVSPITWDAAGRVAASFTFPVEPTVGVTFHVRIEFVAAARQVLVSLSWLDQAIPLNQLQLPESFGDFDLDAFAVLVWDETTSFSDSLLAHGWIDNVKLELPASPIGAVKLTESGLVECASLQGWRYTLEASGDLNDWSAVWSTSGTGGLLALPDPREAIFREQFYRVQAERE